MNEELAKLGEDYWESVLRHDPTQATYLGDMRYNDRLPDISARARASRLAEIRELDQRLRRIEPQEEQDLISWDVLRLKFEDVEEDERHRFFQWHLDHLMGPQVWLQELINYHPLQTEKDYRDLASRYRAFPAYVDAYVENLAEGVREGRTSPRVVAERVIGQLEHILSTPVAESPLSSPVPTRPEAVPEAAGGDLLAAVRDDVYPAFQALLDFLTGGYPARRDVGIWALPGGDEAYRYTIRCHTTTAMAADDIHQLGLDLVGDIEREMKDIARRAGHEGDLTSFRDKLRQDEKLYPTSREELLEGFRSILDELTAMLPRYFGLLPRKATCEVKAIEAFREKDCVAAYYYPPPEDFSRPGIFYANTYQPETRPRHNMAALTVHEAVPGHHLQVALAMELGELPRFRRHTGFNAYVEGWALYTERLAVEMGVYHDPLSLFGMLTYQVWRAARLVVDTGMHAQRWTRQQAVDFFRDHVGLPSGEADNEIDRYIMWPGQALSYAVGMREILQLRREAEAALGSRFSLPAFHDEVLRHGALPLSTLRTLLGRHIERQVRAAV